jgi:hypothetical protein
VRHIQSRARDQGLLEAAVARHSLGLDGEQVAVRRGWLKAGGNDGGIG